MGVQVTQFILILFFVASCFFVIRPARAVSIKKSLIISCALLVVLVASRPSSMADYEQYKNSFLQVDGGLRFEPAFQLIKTFSRLFSSPEIVGFFVFAAISIGIRFSCIINYKKIAWGCVLVYLSNVIIIQDMVAIRAAVASALLIIAVKYKAEGSLIKTLIILLLSVMFHYTAILYFLLLLMNKNKSRRFLYIGLIIISYILSLNGYYFSQLAENVPFLNTIMPLYNAYILEMNLVDTTMNIFNFLQIGHLSICLFFWFNINKLTSYDYRFLLLLKLYTVGICLIPLFAQSFNMAIRLSEMFLSVEIFLIPIGFKGAFKSSFLGNLVLIIYSSVIFYIRLSDMLYWKNIMA